MISYSSTYRSKQTEILDSFDLEGPELELMLNDLKTVNTMLGGDTVSLGAIDALLQEIETDTKVTIVDVGCGDGEMLRKIADHGKRKGYQLKLIGIDANPHIIEIAEKRSNNYKSIHYQVVNIFSEKPIDAQIDIALCTLFLHHFKIEQITYILNKLVSHSKVGVVVNDLHRSRLAFWLFKIFSSIFIKSKIAKHDGLVSIARGFKKRELKTITNQLKNCDASIRWRWAFRWQCIIKKVTFKE